jgi:hypothetical protein
MNTVFGARITALEKATAFNPNNVTIGGSLTIQPNSTQAGTLAVASNGTINGNLTVAKTLNVTQNAIVNGTLSVAGAITFNTLNANNLNTISIVNSGAITSQSVTATTLSGNGAAITSVQAVSAPYSGLTGLVPTWNQSTTGNALTATNVAYTGLTGVIPTWNQNTTGNAATATTATNTTNSTNATNAINAINATITTNLLAGSIGQIPYQSGVSTTSFIPVGAAGQILTSQGAGFSPAWSAASTNDPTKLPLAGGTMTGVLTMLKGIAWETFISKDQGVGENYAPPGNTSKLTTICLQYQNACTLSLVNFAVDLAVFPDNTRYITVIKAANFLAPFNVAITPPVGYTITSPTGSGSASYSMGAGTFSLTMTLWNNTANKRIYITALQ